MKNKMLMVAVMAMCGLLACSPKHSESPQTTDVPQVSKSTVTTTGNPGDVAKANVLILGSNLAEIVVALGAADKVVGIGGGSEHIVELSAVPVIPGFRNTSAENMLALAPNIALLQGRQTRPELVEQLELSDVAVHLFPDDVGNIAAVSDKIARIGEILNRQEAAEALTQTFQQELALAQARIATLHNKPKGLFILSGGGRPTLVAGEDTDIALLMEMAGAQNMTAGIQGFKPMSQEKMLAAAPEFILINKEGNILKGDIPVALTAPGVLLTPAGKNRNIITLPGGYLTGLGLNTPKAILSLASQIHPGFNAEG